MRRDELMPLVVRLGGEFQRRGMKDHSQKLRVYFLALKHGLDSGAREVRVHWTENLVLEWLRLLRIPPYDRSYAIRPRASRCDKCPPDRSSQPAVNTEAVFPGGSKMRCQVCGAVWVEEEAAA